MKSTLTILFAACILLSGCSDDHQKLSREEAMDLLKQETVYPEIIDHDIYCGDPNHARKVLDAGLEAQGLLTVQRTQKLRDVGTKPIIQFTAKSQPYLLPTPESDRASKIQKVKLAEESIKEVTGIRMNGDGKSAVAEYVTTYKNVTPFAVLVKTDFNKERLRTVDLALYDDGWRLERRRR